MAQKLHSSIRISEKEKSFLESSGVSILGATRIGLQLLEMSSQSATLHPCPYIDTSGKCGTQSVAQCGKAPTPPSACCSACPVRNGLAKRYLAAHSHGMNDPAWGGLLDGPLIVQVSRPSSRATLPGPITELLEKDETPEQVVAHDLEPAGPAAVLERILVVPAAARPMQVPATAVTKFPAMTAAEMRAEMEERKSRLKKERTA